MLAGENKALPRKTRGVKTQLMLDTHSFTLAAMKIFSPSRSGSKKFFRCVSCGCLSCSLFQDGDGILAKDLKELHPSSFIQ